MNRAFPFEIDIKEDNKRVFVNTVESVLGENLQSADSFGCLISDCHMHVGSKKHLEEFVEAELLFHNSYYNKRFALLTSLFLENRISAHSNIVLVGYETFCELYLRETFIFLQNNYPNKKVGYCVVETTGKKMRVREAENAHYDEDTYYVFIVPISTTLTTHDKLISTFRSHLEQKRKSGIKFDDQNSCNLVLILIAPMAGNDYWKRDGDDAVVLVDEKRKLLKSLGEQKVYYLASHDVKWKNAAECEKCYPDLEGRPLNEEKPIFEVNRGSVVPMLQLGINKVPEPLDNRRREDGQRNLKKVICLSKYMFHHHIIRNGNHYQYHFDTQAFFEEISNQPDEELSLKVWLTDKVKAAINPETNDEQEKIIYDFLVAPRHHSNAGFVQSVNDIVFGGAGRILYFDTAKEYRGNIKAKYSDFSCLVSNILQSKQPSCIRFHYVDDTIYSGSNYTRTKSLIGSLVQIEERGANEVFDVQLFASVIVLVGRSSIGTKKDYVQMPERFFEYVHVSVSPMRNHGDACTLCQLVRQYRFLEKCSATNQMARDCRRTIKDHKKKSANKFLQREKRKADNEKRLRLILRHLLTETLSNNWWPLKQKPDTCPVDEENTDSVYAVLDEFYQSVHEEFYGENFEIKEIRGALIKVITRPFFTFHIRRRQAAFRFCIEKLENILNKKKVTGEEKYLFGVLINGLADMNANYLIRQQNIKRILEFIEEQKTEYDQTCYFKAVKRIVGTSADDRKSLLLEHILVNGTEQGFFHKDMNQETLDINDGDRIVLYLENNAVLIDGFKKICKYKELNLNEEFPYFLKVFQDIFEVNHASVASFAGQYRALREFLKNEEGDIQRVGEKVGALFPGMEVQVFLRDDDADSKRILWEKYYFLGQDRAQSKEFYSKHNLDELERALAKIRNGNEIKKNRTEENGDDKWPLMDTLYYDATSTIIKIGDKRNGTIYIRIMNPNRAQTGALNVQDNLTILFPVKILLTLRSDWLKYFARCNLPNVKRQLDNAKNKKALVIKKATQHHQLEIFEGNLPIFELRKKYSKMREEMEKTPVSPIAEEMVQSYKLLLDKYVQLLANEYISYVYRGTVSFPVVGFHVKPMYMNEREWTYLKRMGFEESADGILRYAICVANQSSKNSCSECIIKVNIEWDTKSFSNTALWFLKTGGARLRPYYLLMIALVINAGYHYISNGNDGECLFKVWADGQYMRFSNELAKDLLTEEQKKKIETGIYKKKEYPPWECDPADQSITLWALEQYFKRAQNLPDVMERFGTEDDWIDIKVIEKEYILGLKILSREGDTNDNK